MRIQTDTALYVGNGCTMKSGLDSQLQSIGIGLHKASSVQAARQKLCDHNYSLLLVKFEHVRRHIFELCMLVRQKNSESVIFVLMDSYHSNIECLLFDFGVDDVVIGNQTAPLVLKCRINKRRSCRKLSLSDTNKFLLKGGIVVDFGREEVWINGIYRRIKGVIWKLFRYFLENPLRVVSKQELVDSYIWDNSICLPDKKECGKAINMAVVRLRRVIEANYADPRIIITVRGTGWMLAKDAIVSTSQAEFPVADRPEPVNR